jgi:hypothetical protein
MIICFRLSDARFEGLPVVTMKIIYLPAYDMRYGEHAGFHLASRKINVEAAVSSGTSVNYYQTSWYEIKEASNL